MRVSKRIKTDPMSSLLVAENFLIGFAEEIGRTLKDSLAHFSIDNLITFSKTLYLFLSLSLAKSIRSFLREGAYNTNQPKEFIMVYFGKRRSIPTRLGLVLPIIQRTD